MDACWKVEKALKEEGIPYEVVKHGYGKTEKSRAEVIELSGQKLLPVLELPSGEVYRAESTTWPRASEAAAWTHPPPRERTPRQERGRFIDSTCMRVLVTNDDGIAAEGIQSLRRALRELDGVEVHVIAPDSNRSATARSITTRSPLWVEEVEFGDGDRGFATEGTPVDCVRFADLGLLGEKPDLIVSGINHGSNLGDDVTYSGTVAAAFEGIVLGIPAIAISLQSDAGPHGLRARAPVRLLLCRGACGAASSRSSRPSRCRRARSST